MTTAKHIAEHTAFMKWFGDKYPQLNKLYGKQILPAVDETGFIINWKKLDDYIFSALMEITNEYYYLIN